MSAAESVKEEDEGLETESRTTSPERSDWANSPSVTVSSSGPPTSTPSTTLGAVASSNPTSGTLTSVSGSTTEMKFLKYSELARELSGR